MLMVPANATADPGARNLKGMGIFMSDVIGIKRIACQSGFLVGIITLFECKKNPTSAPRERDRLIFMMMCVDVCLKAAARKM